MLYLGIDVSKAKLDCCLLVDAEQLKRRNKSVANTAAGVAALLAWATKQSAPGVGLHAVMEGTGVYHEQAAIALCDAGVTVSVVNPAQVKHLAKGLAVRTKTDTVDSFVLARYGVMLKPPAWTAPSMPARTLRALLARRDAIAQDLQRELNRQEKALATDTPEPVCQSIAESIRFLHKQLAQFDQDIDDHIDRHPDIKQDFTLLTSIPAVGPQVGRNMLSVMLCHRFDSAEQLAAYLGLVPVQRQSGSSVLAPARLSKTWPAHLRAVLYMAAIVATRYNPSVKALYERMLAKSKAKKAALGAAMRKLVHLCFGVVKNKTPYQPNYAMTP